MNMLTQERLHELLNYNPFTGIFTWKVNRSNIKIGDVAGTNNGKDYLVLRIDKHRYYCHRLAWLYVHGNFSKNNIDHINGIRFDNRISNLREATYSENMQNRKSSPSNSTTGFLGVMFDKSRSQWKATIKVNGVYKYLGRYNSAEEAHQAYLVAKRKFHSFCTI